jgi:hypothetical protein
MGEARRRRQLDPQYGTSDRYRIVVSDITGKHLVQTRVGRDWLTATVYLGRGDAERALGQLKQLCDPYSPNQLARPGLFMRLCAELPDDDDEIVATRFGGVWHPPGSSRVKDINAVYAEHGLLSDALLAHRR